MSDVIPATFSDFKLIRGRKVAQLVLEIPIEKAQEALSVLGMPIPGQELWCAVARLKDEPKAKVKRRFEDMPLSQQAAIRCNDSAFQRFVKSAGGGDDAAAFVRKFCRVDSRSLITAGKFTGDRWHELDAQFQDWLGDQKVIQQAEAYAR